MNIFRILSSNDGAINEPNVSSFLAYLLNPNEDHGISSLLLQTILNDLIVIDDTYLKKIQFEGRITDLSTYSGFSINIIPELSVIINNDGKKKRRDIDIVVEIFNDKTKEILYSICIENKITDASISKKDTQLQDELNGLKDYYSDNNFNPEIYVIYLTPHPSEISRNSFEKLNYQQKHHLYWDLNDNSIVNKLINIFNDEKIGIIDPINDQAAYLIKSFISFIKTNFKSYIKERMEKMNRKNYGKSVIELLNEYTKTLNPDEEFPIYKIKKGFSEFVLKNTGLELHNGTRDAHIILSTINNRNRGHYHVSNINDKRKNLFFFSDDTKKTLRRFNAEIHNNIPIYFKKEDKIEHCISNNISYN